VGHSLQSGSAVQPSKREEILLLAHCQNNACRDRATFDPNLNASVNYTVASPADAPDSLTFGPPFMQLAAQLKGEVTLGLNRQLDNQTASLAAAVLAKQQMSNLFAIELGNEPECE
jgi:hypothetical protein